MRNKILSTLLVLILPVTASAQFYTITKESEVTPIPKGKSALVADNKQLAEHDSIKVVINDTIEVKPKNQRYNSLGAQKCNDSTFLKSTKRNCTPDSLPELTIPNLYAEIKRNGILYPKVVLAQAILETG